MKSTFFQRLGPTMLFCLTPMAVFAVEKSDSPATTETSVPVPDSTPAVEPVVAGDIKLGDVLMRSVRVWPKDETDEKDTLATAKEFHVNRIVWVYENSPEFNAKVREEGIGIGTTMAANAREAWQGTLSDTEKTELVERYTIRGLNGEQVLGEHFKKFGDSAWVDHFAPDQTIPDWKEYYIDYVAQLYGTGIDSIHRDDPGSCAWALRSGGTFTDSSIEFFRNYLEENFTGEELRELGVKDVSTFNVRDHFIELGAPEDTTLWQWRGSPLMPVFQEAMAEADRRFFVDVRRAVEERTGKKIPWSLNSGGFPAPLEEAFDFRISEYQEHHNQPQTIMELADYGRQLGMLQAWVTLVQRDYMDTPTFVDDSRRNMATLYASGMVPLVPWCMYMHDAPRYYGSAEDFADIFHFVSANRELFDDHVEVSESGLDLQAKLYSWLPNKEMRRFAGDAQHAIWLNSPNVFAFVRSKPGTESVVVHLVDWNAAPEPFEIAFNPAELVNSEAATLKFLRPGVEPVFISDYTGATITLPKITPWGLLVVEPADLAADAVPAPQLASPRRTVVPEGTPVTFVAPAAGQKILVRFGSGGGDEAGEFVDYDPVNPPIIASDGILEACTESLDGKQSEPLKVGFQVFRDLGIEVDEIAALGEGIDLAEKFAAKKGEMKVNESFLADEVFLGGSRIERSIATQGDTILTTDVDPSWKAFTVSVGIDDKEDRRPSARFQVWFNNRLAYETPIFNPSKFFIAEQDRVVFPIALEIPEGTRRIQLRTVNGGFFADQNHAIWAEPTAY